MANRFPNATPVPAGANIQMKFPCIEPKSAVQGVNLPAIQGAAAGAGAGAAAGCELVGRKQLRASRAR